MFVVVTIDRACVALVLPGVAVEVSVVLVLAWWPGGLCGLCGLWSL